MGTIQTNWTWKEIVSRKKVQLAILTLILTLALIKTAEIGFSSMMNDRANSIFEYHYTLGSKGVVLAIPAALFSLLAMRLWLFTKGVTMNSSAYKRVRGSRQLTRDGELFKTLNISWLIISTISSGIWKVMRGAGLALGYMFGWAIFIVGALSSGGGGGSSGSGGYSGGGAPVSTGRSRNDVKKDADWAARQMQKDADNAWRHAGKQAQYNANTHHFDSRLNRAKTLQREANEAAKRARNL